MAAFTLQQALSGQLSAGGQVAALSSGCSAASQGATASASHLPADFSSARVYCSLVAPQILKTWQDQLEVDDADLFPNNAICVPTHTLHNLLLSALDVKTGTHLIALRYTAYCSAGRRCVDSSCTSISCRHSDTTV